MDRSASEMPMDAEFVVLMSACADMENARKIARKLVELRQAACVQLLPIESFYRWEGEVTEDGEVLMLIKTASEKFTVVSETIRRMHSYEIPEIIQLPITAGLSDYLNWIRQSTRGTE